MPNESNIHWTQDAELLEQFVMHRVEAARRKELEAHLLTCDDCQNAVREEQQLALGIKRVGRDEMKARLKERLAAGRSQPATRSLPWARIVGVAATLVVLFGLGIYNKWIPLGTDEQQSVAERRAQGGAGKVEQKDGERQQPTPGEGARQDEGAILSKDEKPAADATARPTTGLKLDDLRRAEAERDARTALQPSEPAVAGGAARQFDAQADALADAPKPPELFFSGPLWVDGVLTSGRQLGEGLKRAVTTEQRLPAVPQARQEMMQKAKTAAVKVTELPLELLPQTQQMKQQSLDRNIVQTMIEQQNGNLNFTLYRRGGQQRLKTENATLEQVDADSVVIFLDGEQIGYKIRGGLDALQQLKATKK